MEHILSRRARSRDLAADSRLTCILRRRDSGDSDVHDVCRILNLVLQIGERLTPTDILIISAVISCSNLSAAARMLAPGRPSYRRYISKLIQTKFIPIVEELLGAKRCQNGARYW
jgi:hypothetical protein